MPAAKDKMAIRISAPFLAALLVLTPTTQALAQAEQQAQEPQATQTEARDDEQEAALTNARVAEPDTVQLLRLGATSLFPKTDASPVDLSAATPTAAALSPAATVVIVVLVVLVVLVVTVFIVCATGGCKELTR